METSTSVYGPTGATMTLNSFFVARCTSTLLPLGAPVMSSTAHCPSTVVQPSTPLLSKSNFSSGALSGIFACPTARRTRGHPPLINEAAESANFKIRRRLVFRIASLVELLRHRLPLVPLHQCHVSHGVTILHGREDTDDPIALVVLDRLGRGGAERALR